MIYAHLKHKLYLAVLAIVLFGKCCSCTVILLAVPGALCLILQGWVVRDRSCCKVLIIQTDQWEKGGEEDTVLGEKGVKMSSVAVLFPATKNQADSC